ncbi:MAG: hypothetical protein ACLQQ4_00430 [Bacteroidia bacterium]
MVNQFNLQQLTGLGDAGSRCNILLARGHANKSYAAHTGEAFVKILEDATAKEGSIEYLSIYSHSSNVSLILDLGQYGKQELGYNQWNSSWTYTSMTDKIVNNPKIKFAPNALVVFAGCNSGIQKTDAKGQEYFNLAMEFTKQTGVASIGASGATSPQGKDHIRTADQQYYLFVKDDQGQIWTFPLGKKLTKEAIATAKAYANDFAKQTKPQDTNKKDSSDKK